MTISGSNKTTFALKVNSNDISGTNKTTFTVKVNNNGGIISSATPITVKNQIQEQQIYGIKDIPDVAEVNVITGSTLVFNAETNLYEIKMLDIDGGTF